MDLSSWVGIPFADRGRSRLGADCWGLACLVYAEGMRIMLPSYADAYGPLAERERAELSQLIVAHRGDWREIEASQERGADLILLRIAGALSHIGIVAKPGSMLTVRRGGVSLIENYRGPKWRPRIAGFFRHRHVEF